MATTKDLETIRFGFDVREAVGIDRRLVLTKEEMRTGIVYWDGADYPVLLSNILPDRYLAICQEDLNIYVYYKQKDPCMDLKCKCCGAMWIGNFKLVTKVLEVLDTETAESLVDSEGFVHIYDANGAIQKQLEYDVYSTTDSEAVTYRLNDLENRKSDKTWVSEQVVAQTMRKQNRLAVHGDADKITGYDSEGDPILEERGVEWDASGNVTFDGAGVHVTYDKDSLGHSSDPTKPIELIIRNDDVISSGFGAQGWTAVYDCGGIAAGRYIDPSTSIKEVVRLMLVGDPQYENIVYFGALDHVPDDESEIGRMTFKTLSYDTMFPLDITDATYDFETSKAFDLYDKFWIIALPGKTWNRGISGKYHFVTLPEVWEHSAPQYTYELGTKVLSGEGNFKIWYITTQGTTHDQYQMDCRFKTSVTQD